MQTILLLESSHCKIDSSNICFVGDRCYDAIFKNHSLYLMINENRKFNVGEYFYVYHPVESFWNHPTTQLMYEIVFSTPSDKDLATFDTLLRWVNSKS